MSITISIKIPAKVQNVDKALELVGGVDLIAKVTNSVNLFAASSNYQLKNKLRYSALKKRTQGNEE